MEDCDAKTNNAGENLNQIVEDLRLKVPCKNRDAGCTHKGIDDELEEHEDECGYRKIKCDYKRCEYNLFKELINRIKDTHNKDCNVKKWRLTIKTEPSGGDKYACFENAYTYEIGPDGLVLITYVCRHEPFFHMAVKVMGGKQVAKKYRAELRVSSNESIASVTHSGPVYPIDCWTTDATKNKESFEMSCPRFAFFNHGKEYFGDHNKDKNGDVVLPLSIKIEKKELRLPTN